MATYSADEIVGKSINAANDVQLYYDAALSIPAYIVKKGQTIGTVYSWVQPKHGNGAGKLIWMIDNPSRNSPYPYVYVSSDQPLQAPVQAISEEQKKAEAEEARRRNNEDWVDKTKRLAVPLLLLGVGGAALIKLGTAAIDKVGAKTKEQIA